MKKCNRWMRIKNRIREGLAYSENWRSYEYRELRKMFLYVQDYYLREVLL